MSKTMRVLLASVFVMSLSGPTRAESPRDEIEAALVSFAAAFNKGDAAAVAAHYAEDAAVLPPDSARIDGRLGIETFWKGAIDAGVSDLALKAVEVVPGGDYAFEIGEVSFSMKGTDGAKATSAGKYIVVWKKNSDGTWHLYRDIWNANQAK